MARTDAPACCGREYDVLAADHRVFRMHADSADDACRRAADLYHADVVAWRRPATALVVADARRIIG